MAPRATRPTPTPTTAPDKIRVDRSSDAADAASGLDANAYTSGDTIVMPQHHGPLDRGRGQALLAHELVHVGQQRRLGSSLPAEHTGAGQQLEREAQSAESLVERARTAPLPDMPVARSGAQRAAAEVSTSQSGEIRQASQLALAAGPGSTSSESIELPAGRSLPAADAGVAPQRAAMSSASSRSFAASSSDAGGDAGVRPAKPTDDQEFEELARKLYEHLRLRFKRELLLDRERSGFLADSR